MVSMTPPENVSRGLPRHDFIILPLLSILTVAVMFGMTEAAARMISPEVRLDSCRMHADAGGDRYQPNCTSRTKLFNGPWVVNEYNECGYRSRASCGKKPAGTIRIAALGTSAATGFMVPYQQTVWGIMEKTLTQECRRPVEVQNLAVFGTGLNLAEQAHRVDEALALKPDLIILMASGNDLPGVEDWRPSGVPGVQVVAPPKKQMDVGEFLDGLKIMVRRSAAMTALRYFLYRDDQTYLKIYMSTQGEDMGYLRVPFSPKWQQRLSIFESLLGTMADKARAQGVPFVLVPSIFRAQVLLLHLQGEFPGIDPYAFDRQMQAIAQNHEFLKYEVSGDFGQVKDSRNLYYLADGHFSPQGHEIFSQAIIRQIRETRVLEAAGCVLTDTAN
jgi:hypothetical protein